MPSGRLSKNCRPAKSRYSCLNYRTGTWYPTDPFGSLFRRSLFARLSIGILREWRDRKWSPGCRVASWPWGHYRTPQVTDRAGNGARSDRHSGKHESDMDSRWGWPTCPRSVVFTIRQKKSRCRAVHCGQYIGGSKSMRPSRNVRGSIPQYKTYSRGSDGLRRLDLLYVCVLRRGFG